MILIWTTGASETKPESWHAAAAKSCSAPVLCSPPHQLVCYGDPLEERLGLVTGPCQPTESIKIFSNMC